MNHQDSEQQPAADFGYTTENEDGCVISWFLEDEQQCVNITVGADGAMTAALEDFSGG